MDVNTLLRGDVLGWAVQGWSAQMVLGQPPSPGSPGQETSAPWAQHSHLSGAEGCCPSRSSLASQPPCPTLTLGRNLAGQSGVSPECRVKGSSPASRCWGGTCWWRSGLGSPRRSPGQGVGRTVSAGLFIQQTLRRWHEAKSCGMRKNQPREGQEVACGQRDEGRAVEGA